jgi:hypothetical protein
LSRLHTEKKLLVHFEHYCTVAHAPGDPDPIADIVPSSSNGAKKRRQEEAPDTPAGTGTGTGPAAKVARLASTEEETIEQDGDETPDAPLTKENIMNLLKDLWSDDKCVILRALIKIGDIGTKDISPYENEGKIRGLGGHTVVFQVLEKHVGCFEIQKLGMRALGNLSHLLPTKKLLGDIGCVEVILARMEKYPDSERVQLVGCFVIRKLVFKSKDNAKGVEKCGGIAVVIAAMRAHPNCKELQNHGCMALSYMSEWEEYRPLILEAGGASAFSFVMETYRADPVTRKCAFNALKLFVTE